MEPDSADLAHVILGRQGAVKYALRGVIRLRAVGRQTMITKRAIDWESIGRVLITPEVLGTIVGGVGLPLITYRLRRNQEMPKWRRIAELLGAGALGAMAGLGTGFTGRVVSHTPAGKYSRLPPELIVSALVGGTTLPLAVYLARRNEDISTKRMIAELIGAGALGSMAGVGAYPAGLIAAYSIHPKVLKMYNRLRRSPEAIGAIVGGVGAPLATYLVRRKKEMPKWRRIAELLGAGVLGAGAGAGIGYGGKMVYDVVAPYPPTLSNRMSLRRYINDKRRIAYDAARYFVSPAEADEHFDRLRVWSDNTAALLEQLKQAKSPKELENMQFLFDSINSVLRQEAAWHGSKKVYRFKSLEDALRNLGAIADWSLVAMEAERDADGDVIHAQKVADKKLPAILRKWGLEPTERTE